jgi:hypothetical protein
MPSYNTIDFIYQTHEETKSETYTEVNVFSKNTTNTRKVTYVVKETNESFWARINTYVKTKNARVVNFETLYLSLSSRWGPEGPIYIYILQIQITTAV